LNALRVNTTGFQNTATGAFALGNGNTIGNFNMATGAGALFNNTTGNNNTAIGLSALVSNTTGSGNIALGVGAGGQIIASDNNIDIGNEGVASDSNTIRIGTTQTATYIAGIAGGTPAMFGAIVVIDSNGRLVVSTSSQRFKDEIKPMDRAAKRFLRCDQ